MRPSRLALIATALASGAALLPASAHALRFTPCPHDSHFECTWLQVPLDPSHVTPGTLRLRVKRLISSRARKRALIAMAGGPGQGATSSADDFAITIGPARRQRQLIVFDQRGTGDSQPLNCPEIQRRGDALDNDAAFADVGKCGAELGPRRAFYTTTESVADIEALRQALHVSRVSLLGVSYGTYVAQRYAAAHPDHTERLILDSLVPQSGGDIFELPTFRAVPRVLRELCRARACAGVTRDPLVEIATLLGRLRSSPLTGRIYDRRGKAREASFAAGSKVFDLLLAGDINPLLRVTLLAAVKAANSGDPAPLLRLDAISRYGTLKLADDSNALFVATVCEESPVPWDSPQVPIDARAPLTAAQLAAVPELAVAPFDRPVALDAGGALLCRLWPQTPVAPVPAPATISAPTLVLSGRDDLRTPTEQARAATALIPGSAFVDVAGTGHSVMTADFTGCVERAVTRFLSAKTVGQPCRGHSNTLLDPAPAPPGSVKDVPTVPGLPRLVGRTVNAAVDTLDDVAISALTQLINGQSEPITGGGLRGGRYAIRYIGDDGSRQRIHGVVLVPGVHITGVVRRIDGLSVGGGVTVTGKGALNGQIRFHSDGLITGKLGRTHLRLAPAGVARASAHPEDALAARALRQAAG